MQKLLKLFIPLLIFSCDTEEKETLNSLGGKRFKTNLVRAADEKDWVEVKGSQEWFFFNGGVFRQIAADYVEPQFYGDIMACSGSGSGTWTEDAPTDNANSKNFKLAYDGTKDIKGLCRMSDRVIKVFFQPSGVVDMIDSKRVTRMEVMEEIN